jgi:hypothetical protein
MFIAASVSKCVWSLLIANERFSGKREVNTTPLAMSEVGEVDKMPAEATEWRFSIRRDIIVTLIL